MCRFSTRVYCTKFHSLLHSLSLDEHTIYSFIESERSIVQSNDRTIERSTVVVDDVVAVAVAVAVVVVVVVVVVVLVAVYCCLLLSLLLPCYQVDVLPLDGRAATNQYTSRAGLPGGRPLARVLSMD